MKKKNLIRSSWMGYCPFSVLSHDTVDCIVTQVRRGSQGQAGHGHDTALRHNEERPRHGQEGHNTAGLRARALPGQVESRYKIVLWLGGGLVCRDTARGLAVGLYRETGSRHGARAATRQAATCAGARRYNARHGQPGLRHGQCWACEMAGARPQYGAMCAAWAHYACNLGSGCAPGAPNPVLNSVHCFSHCFDHCS